MKVETVYSGIRYTLSNDNLKVGDKVFPVAWGRCLEDGGWILHDFDFSNMMCGFPDEPHVIMDLNYDNGRQGKAYQVKTNKGYSPIECYYKIIKMEDKVKVQEHMLGGRWEWFEVDCDYEWVCNECNTPNFTSAIPEAEIENEEHACINCGCFEFHSSQKIIEKKVIGYAENDEPIFE